ncbi:MAG: heme exporter protein CcmB [Chloroflexi bacterium]|nr:heme exporter protein CcmB [Chloroflexota bacterium]
MPLLVVAWKDIRLELRTRELVTSILVFALLAVIIFTFAFDPTPERVALVMPGTVWVAFTFAGTLGFNRSFMLEKDRGSLEGLLLCPVTRDVIYLGKLLGVFLFMSLVELLLLPVFSALLNFPLLDLRLIAVALLATLGFAGVGTLFSAIAVNTRSREIMLPILLLPVAVPVVIAAVEATGALLEGASFGEVRRWWQLLLAYDVVFLVVSAFLFGFALEE